MNKTKKSQIVLWMIVLVLCGWVVYRIGFYTPRASFVSAAQERADTSKSEDPSSEVPVTDSNESQEDLDDAIERDVKERKRRLFSSSSPQTLSSGNCPSCGAEAIQGKKYCPDCGQRL